MKKLLFSFFTKASLSLLLLGATFTKSQALGDADPTISALPVQPTIVVGTTTVLRVDIDNLGYTTNIATNTLDATVSIGGNAEIRGIITDSSNANWTQSSLTSGPANAIHLQNTYGPVNVWAAAPQTIYLLVKGIGVTSPALQPITVHIQYQPNPLYFAQGNLDYINDQNTTSLTVIAASNPLPVRLSSFTANAVPGRCEAQLQWATGEERNFDHFTVQYSTDGSSFQSAANIKSNGNTMGSTYNYTMEQSAGKTYYRLQMVDLDGTTNYSNTLSVLTQCNSATPEIWSVYPNPSEAGSTQHLQYTNTNNSDQTLKVVVSDLTGRRIWNVDVKAAPGKNIYSIPSGDWPRGSYLINLYNQHGDVVNLAQKIFLQ